MPVCPDLRGAHRAFQQAATLLVVEVVEGEPALELVLRWSR
jgi:hypothetical protein